MLIFLIFPQSQPAPTTGSPAPTQQRTSVNGESGVENTGAKFKNFDFYLSLTDQAKNEGTPNSKRQQGYQQQQQAMMVDPNQYNMNK